MSAVTVSLNKIKSDIANIGLGNGQTWQDVTASRAKAVVYTNSTGRSIEVKVSFTGSEGYLFLNGVNIGEGTSSGTMGSVSFIVPGGDSYVFYENLNTATITSWWELR